MDNSFILLNLNIVAGSHVIETGEPSLITPLMHSLGTGSGSLSYSLATAAGPSGRLTTFEFNKERAEKARELFATLKVNNVRVVWRDSCSFGFLPGKGDTGDPLNEQFPLKAVHAVFLDLPKPWEAIPHAHTVLKRGGRICCFSPCIEQVQRSCEKLAEMKYQDIRTFEVLLRNLEKRTKNWKSLPELEQKLLLSKQKRQAFLDAKAKEAEAQAGGESTKKQILEDEEEKEKAVPADDKPAAEAKGEKKGKQGPKKMPEVIKVNYFTQGMSQERGHTGYLTFAMKP
jgi:tRNA (adenine57-N1/adenine58-N1)-methyltransferase